MSDDVEISGGGSTVVASDELLWHAELLRQLSAEAQELVARLGVIDSSADGWSLARAGGPWAAARAEDAIDSARHQLYGIGEESRGLSGALLASAESYARVERFVGHLSEQASAAVGYLTGVLLPLTLLWLVPALSGAAAGAVLGTVLAPGGPKAVIAGLEQWVKENSRLVSNPTVVSLLRSAIMSSDDAIMGAVHVPPSIAALLGDEGVGLTGVGMTAALLSTVGGKAGILGETGVRTVQTSETTIATPPQGFAERMERVPNGDNGGSQLLVERYSIPGEPDRFEVYVAGTADFSPLATDEPWDMTSNVAGVGGLPAGSYRAAVDALAQAGVTPDSPIVFNGFSQGGLIAAMLAGSGDYNTAGLLTFGAPAGNVALPDTFPAIAVEHSEDIVPATGGDQINPSVIVARRDVFGDTEVPTYEIFPAHQRDTYTSTAHLLDEQHSTLLMGAIHTLDNFGAGATEIVATTYHAERVPG
ncbi:MAG: hypothetical protein ABJB03_07510 [Rhodoglobus sp.]